MWKTLSSKIVFKNPWWQIIKKDFEMPNKKRGEYYILDTKGSSMIVPIKGSKIVFEKEYRYPINEWVIQLPNGQAKHRNKFVQAAKDELQEETGYRARSIKKIGRFCPMNGVTNEITEVFLAAGLKFVGKSLEETEQIKNIEIDIKKAYKMIGEGKITDGQTLASLAIARKYLLKT